jgi:arsenite transporter
MLVKFCLNTQHWFRDFLKGMSVPEALAKIMDDLAKLKSEVNHLQVPGANQRRDG